MTTDSLGTTEAVTWKLGDRFGRRALATVMLVGLLGLFGFDLFFVENVDTAGAVALPVVVSDFTADLTFKSTRYDPAARAMLADLDVQVFSRGDIVFQDLSIAIRKTGTGADERIPFMQTAFGECTLQAAYDDPRTDASVRSTGAFLCPNVTLAAPLDSTEVWYPFDRYAAPLVFQLCVNTREACPPAPEFAVRVRRVRVEPDRTHLIASLATVEDQSLTVQLQRRLFLRLVSVVFLVMVLFFVVYLVVAVDPRDTMTKSLGVFAALWGLRSMIVPSSITAFPTIVEGAIMAIFCVVFALVFIRATDV